MCDLVFIKGQYDIQTLVQTYFNKLSSIWYKIFDQDACKENVVNLEKHLKNYFENLVTKALDKEKQAENKIENLRTEAGSIKRLLKVEIDTKPSEGVPLLVYQSEFDKSLTELRETLRIRRELVLELLHEQDILCAELGKESRPVTLDPLPSEKEIEEIKKHLESLKVEKHDRLNKIFSMRREIKKFSNILEITKMSENEDHLLDPKETKITKENMRAIEEIYVRYQDAVLKLEYYIDTTRKKLNSLWNLLGTDNHTRQKFKQLTKPSQETADMLTEELNRCEFLKKQNIKLFIDKIRMEIVEWWDICKRSEFQRNLFTNFNSDYFTDNLLTLHEIELEDLKTFYHKNQKIFQLFEERRILWQKMRSLDKKGSDPGHYNNRGGNLLKEEKARKTIANKLPKIEQLLKSLVRDYEKKERKKFLIYGEDINDVIARDWEEKKKEKEKLDTLKKNSRMSTIKRTINTTNNFPLRKKFMLAQSNQKRRVFTD